MKILCLLILSMCIPFYSFGDTGYYTPGIVLSDALSDQQFEEIMGNNHVDNVVKEINHPIHQDPIVYSETPHRKRYKNTAFHEKRKIALTFADMATR